MTKSWKHLKKWNQEWATERCVKDFYKDLGPWLRLQHRWTPACPPPTVAPPQKEFVQVTLQMGNLILADLSKHPRSDWEIHFFFRLFYKLTRFKPVFSSSHLSGRAQLPSKAGSCNQGFQEPAQEGVFYGQISCIPQLKNTCSGMHVPHWNWIYGDVLVVDRAVLGSWLDSMILGVFYNLNDSTTQSAGKRAK